jgi:hypothetical protein
MPKPSVPTDVIDVLYAYIAQDQNGNEGICGFQSVEGWMPLVFSNRARSLAGRLIAQDIARQTGETIRLVKFSSREVLEVIEP